MTPLHDDKVRGTLQVSISCKCVFVSGDSFDDHCKSEVRLARSARGIVVDEGFDPYPYPLSGPGGSHQRMS